VIRFTRSILVGIAMAASATVALAGASSVPTNYEPDPALQRASRTELEARIRKACTITQARLQNVSETALSSPCGCYASRTFRSMSQDEVQAYRDTGVFNDNARAKALAAIDSCKLQRPI
jgi:hypothetical protein